MKHKPITFFPTFYLIQMLKRFPGKIGKFHDQQMRKLYGSKFSSMENSIIEILKNVSIREWIQALTLGGLIFLLLPLM